MDKKADSDSTFREQEIAIEREKLAVEREKIQFERTKSITTVISVCVPLLAVFVTVWAGIRTQNQKNVNDFNIKAAEITLNNTDNPWVAHNRAQSLRAIFPTELPEDFARNFKPENIGVDETNGKRELLNLIAAHPEQAAKISEIWFAIFPSDPWIKEVIPKIERIK